LEFDRERLDFDRDRLGFGDTLDDDALEFEEFEDLIGGEKTFDSVDSFDSFDAKLGFRCEQEYFSSRGGNFPSMGAGTSDVG